MAHTENQAVTHHVTAFFIPLRKQCVNKLFQLAIFKLWFKQTVQITAQTSSKDNKKESYIAVTLWVSSGSLSFKWYHQESNRGHKDFQSFALPTELWHHHFLFAGAKVGIFFCIGKFFLEKMHEFEKKTVPLHSLLRQRDVAQLVAHYVRDVGVGRSSRLIPTEGEDWSNSVFAFVLLKPNCLPSRPSSWGDGSPVFPMEMRRHGAALVLGNEFFCNAPTWRPEKRSRRVQCGAKGSTARIL